MIGLGSLKTVGEVQVEATKHFRPLKVFAGGIMTATGGSEVKPDAEGGLLTLGAGTYLLMLTGNVTFASAHAPDLALALILGGDVRYRGPRTTVNKRNRNITLIGTVVVPVDKPASCEIWGQADDVYPTKLTISNAELLAVLLQTPAQEGHS